MADQSQSGYDSGYESDPSRPTTPVNGQTQAISPYSSYMGSYGTSPYTMPYGASMYPPSSSTTSMGTAYGDGKGAATQAEALNERSGGDQLHVYKEQGKFDSDLQHKNEGIEAAQMAGALGIAGLAVGAAAGSIRSTKLDKHGQPVKDPKTGEVVKSTSKGKGAVIGLLVGLGAGAGWSIFNRN